jgi:hypothetical protein
MADGTGRTRRLGFFAALLIAAAAGCSTDILDVDVDLATQSFALDFGQQSGTIPTASCNDTIVQQVCASAPPIAVDTSSTTGVPSDVEVQLGCDAGSGQCYMQASAHASQPVDVLQDDSFSSRVERHMLSFVQLADVAYTIPVNTLTFDIPQIDIYAGPAGSTRETDPGVALVGSTQPIAAGTVVTEPLHVIIDKDTPARPVIEHAVENKQEFVFIVVAKPRLGAGAPIPAGAVQIDVAPKLVVGL